MCSVHSCFNSWKLNEFNTLRNLIVIANLFDSFVLTVFFAGFWSFNRQAAQLKQGLADRTAKTVVSAGI